MKVRRQNLSEEYTTTAGWVRDFSNGLTKNADFLSNLKSIMKKRNDFDTIEEKMADLRSRVGFDLVKSIDGSKDENVKEAGKNCNCDTCSSGGDCGCNCGCGTCGLKSDKKQLAMDAKRIIEYIKDLANDRPDIGYEACIAHCREHPTLGFDRVEKRLNSKFSDAVRSILGNHKKDPEAVEYISGVDVVSTHDDDTADYYSHANG